MLGVIQRAIPEGQIRKSQHIAFNPAFDALGGAVWRKGQEERHDAEKKAEGLNRSKALTTLKLDACLEAVDPTVDFMDMAPTSKAFQLRTK